ncbi:glutathione S-transferase [Hydrogenophaga crassostreae]|uniref:Glutathione S-transferase n=1 Tax=Hydrogenophaga crassostreae TaxID=1763535 RepID=A0A167GU32_9BURK|nr:glutathione S-transferase family protein [Hydrogenophaga crassostreae]AOW11790.1 glutathione S-transferase [Hydrogenophaga crassostreae]OAD39883.1 glutathione S-transferase [Hydrogenophaga crassostreae]
MIRLHYFPSTASMVPHILLEEVGVAYERVLVDRVNDAQKLPAYLELNPNGLIPVLTDGELVLYETAAITLHLCDIHPESGLAPALGTPERAHFYKWLMWLTNTLQSTLMVYFYPGRWLDAGNAEGAAEVKRHAEERAGVLLDQVEAELVRHGQSWLLGEAYSALDPYLFTLCRWTREFALTPPARDRRQLGRLLLRMLERPAVQRTLNSEGLGAPFV